MQLLELLKPKPTAVKKDIKIEEHKVPDFDNEI